MSEVFGEVDYDAVIMVTSLPFFLAISFLMQLLTAKLNGRKSPGQNSFGYLLTGPIVLMIYMMGVWSLFGSRRNVNFVGLALLTSIITLPSIFLLVMALSKKKFGEEGRRKFLLLFFSAIGFVNGFFMLYFSGDLKGPWLWFVRLMGVFMLYSGFLFLFNDHPKARQFHILASSYTNSTLKVIGIGLLCILGLVGFYFLTSGIPPSAMIMIIGFAILFPKLFK
jgi:hypothetical protein